MKKTFRHIGLIVITVIIIMLCLLGCSTESKEEAFRSIFGFSLSPYAEIQHFRSDRFGGIRFDITVHQSDYNTVMSDFRQYLTKELAMDLTENQFNESFLDGQWWDRQKMKFLEGYEIDISGRNVKTSSIWIVVAKENDIYHIFIEHCGD